MPTDSGEVDCQRLGMPSAPVLSQELCIFCHVLHATDLVDVERARELGVREQAPVAGSRDGWVKTGLRRVEQWLAGRNDSEHGTRFAVLLGGQKLHRRDGFGGSNKKIGENRNIGIERKLA